MDNTSMKNYGNGILASNDFLASIAQECLEQDKRNRQYNREMSDIADTGNDFYSSKGYGTWNISDRD
tara:strand:+ start:890 stop:1090 length:201 start_codon:yes stop_codon:yes gene_type:complete